MYSSNPLCFDGLRLRVDDLAASPRLFVWRERVDENLLRMRTLLESIAPGTGFHHLRPHAKTCKSSWTIQRQMAAGITKFKASPNELSLLLSSGVRDIVLSYPPLPSTAEAIAQALRDFRSRGEPLRLIAQAGAPEHIEFLSTAAREHGVQIECLLDLDVGMGRTGAAPDCAVSLYQRLNAEASLRFAGLHVYDGHNHSAVEATRTAESARSMSLVAGAARLIRAAGGAVPLVVAAGSPAFLPDLRALLAAAPESEIEVSPGTWIYWDTNYDRLMPGMFRFAALILARVMDRPGKDRVTLDLGHKRWAIDSGPIERFSVNDLEVIKASEEHTVLKTGGAARALLIGDPVLFVPRHICSTVNLWEEFSIVGPTGEIELPHCPVDGRNR